MYFSLRILTRVLFLRTSCLLLLFNFQGPILASRVLAVSFSIISLSIPFVNTFSQLFSSFFVKAFFTVPYIDYFQPLMIPLFGLSTRLFLLRLSTASLVYHTSLSLSRGMENFFQFLSASSHGHVL